MALDGNKPRCCHLVHPEFLYVFGSVWLLYRSNLHSFSLLAYKLLESLDGEEFPPSWCPK